MRLCRSDGDNYGDDDTQDKNEEAAAISAPEEKQQKRHDLRVYARHTHADMNTPTRIFSGTGLPRALAHVHNHTYTSATKRANTTTRVVDAVFLANSINLGENCPGLADMGEAFTGSIPTRLLQSTI
eukprot:2065077-Pleurochrysis_carterae.AAC.5